MASKLGSGVVVMDEKPTAEGTASATSDDDVGSRTQEAVPVLQTPKKTWRSYVWDTFDKSPEERRFLFKLDAVILTFASLGYFIKYLDQVNVNSAFVSGMKEDLGLYGNQLNYMITCWTVGYVIGEIPRLVLTASKGIRVHLLILSSNMLLTKIRPSIWIPACEVTWAVLTISLSKCTTATQIYVLRFFIGLAESAFYPGMQYIIGSWYRKDELAKRSCIFHMSSSIGTMFSGYLMTATYRLNDVHGYRGWQWLFIVNTIISLPIAIAGFFFFPDVPEITRAWWLKPEEIELAKRRMELEGRANRGRYSKAKFKKIFSSWHIYLLTLLYVLFNNGSNYGSQPVFALWLKSEGYPVSAVNSYPTLAPAVQIIFTLIYAWTSDTVFRGERWPCIVFSGVVNIITNSSMAAWNIPNGWKWTCLILGSIGGGISGINMAWAHEICSDDNEERALVVGTMNEMAYVVQAWLPLLIWQQVESPRYQKGFITMVFVAAGMIATALTIRVLHRKERAKKMRAQETEG